MFFEDNLVIALEWASSNAALKLIKHLWNDVKNALSTQNIANLGQLFKKATAAWEYIRVEA